MDNIGVFCFGTCSCPRIFVIGAAAGKAVVACGENDIVIADDTRSDLCVRVLAALCRQQGNSHKVNIP